MPAGFRAEVGSPSPRLFVRTRTEPLSLDALDRQAVLLAFVERWTDAPDELLQELPITLDGLL